MKVLGMMLYGLIIFTLGAIAHENDMAANCARDGNAHAWINEIKCEVSK